MQTSRSLSYRCVNKRMEDLQKEEVKGEDEEEKKEDDDDKEGMERTRMDEEDMQDISLVVEEGTLVKFPLRPSPAASA